MGSFGNGDGQFYFPRGIAVDRADGTVYVVDMGNHRIRNSIRAPTCAAVADQMGRQLEAGHASSPLAQEAGQLRSPWGIAVDGQGDVYVTDTGNHRLEKFDREGNFIAQWVDLAAGTAVQLPVWHCRRPARQCLCGRQRQYPECSNSCRPRKAASGCRKKRMPQQSWGRWILPRRSNGDGQARERVATDVEKEIRLRVDLRRCRLGSG